MTGPLRVTAAVLLALVVALHTPVFTRGALVTPAGGHYGQWPWKAYGREVVSGGALIEHNDTLSDLLFQVYPWQLYTARSLQSGWIPLWNPYSYCGVPFVANAQSAVFYPLHWPAWVFPSMRVFTLAILAKILLAGIFMAIFLRGLGCRVVPCVVGSVSFALCGFMTSWLGYAHTNAALLLPLLMHSARMLATRPSTAPFLVLVFAGAAQYLGGHPETSLHIVGASAVYFLWNLRDSVRPRLAAALFLGGSLLALTMSAVQMLPFVEYLRRSAALEQRRALEGMDPSLPLDAPLTLLLPGYFGRTVDGSYAGPAAWQALAGYAGAGVLLLALISLRWWKRARFFAALAVVSGVVVYGPELVRAGLRLLPVVGISSNNRLLLLLSFALAVLAALALEGIASRVDRDEWRDRAVMLGVTGAGALILTAVALTAPGRDPIGGRLAAALVGGTALLLALAIIRPARQTLYLIGLAAITCIDLFLFAAGYNPHADPGALFNPTRLTDFLRRDAAADMVRGGRIMTVGWVMRPETQMPYWLSSIEGYDAMEFAEYRHLLDRAQVGHIHQTGEIPAASRPLLDLLGMRYVVTPPGGVVSGDKLTMVYDGTDGRVFLNGQARPRLSFVPGEVETPAGDRRRALEILAAGGVDLDREVLLETRRDPGKAAGGRPGSPTAAPAISLERNAPGALAITVRGGPGYLVVGDSYDAGWKASVNGEPADVLRANYTFMAVRLPAGGEAAVTLTYRPLSFRAGAWVSAVSLMFAITIGLVGLGTAGHQADLNAARRL